jgi:hypothetical protein
MASVPRLRPGGDPFLHGSPHLRRDASHARGRLRRCASVSTAVSRAPTAASPSSSSTRRTPSCRAVPTKILASNTTTLRPHRRVVPFRLRDGREDAPAPADAGHSTTASTALAGRAARAGLEPRTRRTSPWPRRSTCLERINPAFVNFAPGYEGTWNLKEYQAILRHLSDNSPNPANRGRVFSSCSAPAATCRASRPLVHTPSSTSRTRPAPTSPRRARGRRGPAAAPSHPPGGNGPIAVERRPVLVAGDCHPGERMRPTLFAHDK